MNAWDPRLKWRVLTISDGKTFSFERYHLGYLKNYKKENMEFALLYFGRRKGTMMFYIPWAKLNWAQSASEGPPDIFPLTLKHCSHQERIKEQALVHLTATFCFP